MRARARIVQFSPDPFSGSRFTIGAVVETGGRVEFVRAHLIPDAHCLGGHAPWTTLNLTLDALAAAPDAKQRSGAISQLASIGPDIELPDGVADAASWVSRVLLPRGTPAPSTQHPKRERRDSIGFKLLEDWGVAAVVQKRFHIETLLGSNDVRLVHRPSHFVHVGAEILLMEPFVGSRPSLEHDLIEVKESFLAHQRLFQVTKNNFEPSYLAYVAPRGYRGAIAEVSDALRATGATIVNTEDSSQRDQLLARIRVMGAKANQQFGLT